MVQHRIGGAWNPTDTGCLTFLFGADGSAAGVADGSDEAGGVVLVVVGAGGVAGGAGKPPAVRKSLVCVVWRVKENDDAKS
jgi:hypothetical protein